MHNTHGSVQVDTHIEDLITLILVRDFLEARWNTAQSFNSRLWVQRENEHERSLWLILFPHSHRSQCGPIFLATSSEHSDIKVYGAEPSASFHRTRVLGNYTHLGDWSVYHFVPVVKPVVWYLLYRVPLSNSRHFEKKRKKFNSLKSVDQLQLNSGIFFFFFFFSSSLHFLVVVEVRLKYSNSYRCIS